MSSQQLGKARRSKRPPAIPDDVADPAVVKATGRVSLPTRVRWSAPARSYDLADRRQRARVYEQVLVEGVEQDVREIIDVDELVAPLEELAADKIEGPGRRLLAAEPKAGGVALQTRVSIGPRANHDDVPVRAS